jgi:nitrite reductase/ring-hydroxylating ferredoxin subunit
VLVCKIGGEFYAYRNGCADGGRPLDDALFESPMLTCSCHGYRYDLRRGLAVERPELRLARLPLKVEEDKVKVAL